MRSHFVFGIRVDDLSERELADMLRTWLVSSQTHTVVTPNPEILLAGKSDPTFASCLNRAELSLPDGVGVRFAVAALTDSRLEHRHTGVDTLRLLAELCAQMHKRLLLLGGAPGIAEKAASVLRSEIPGLLVRAIDPGKLADPAAFDLSVLSAQDAAVIAVGLGQGKQERIMERIRSSGQSNAGILIGVGGAFDMISGCKPRAPAWARRAGFEWAWRLLIEPRRWKRILRAFLIFPIVVVCDTLKSRRFVRACRATVPEIFQQLKKG